MARSGVAALTLAVVLALFEFGSCLRCYQCVSKQDKTCTYSPPPKRFLKDCSTQTVVDFNMLYPDMPSEIGDTKRGKSYCHKVVFNTGTIVRTCLAVTCDVVLKYSKGITDDDKKVKYCNWCDKDECNAASSLAASLPLASLAPIISYFYTQ